MIDQLSDVGVEFDAGSLRRIFAETERYYRNNSMAAALPTKEAPPAKGKPPKAIAAIKARIPNGPKGRGSKIVPVLKWANDEILEQSPCETLGHRCHPPHSQSLLHSGGLHHSVS